MNKDELTTILELHAKWLRGDPAGKRADLYGATLYGADLSGAYLRSANLSGADLRNADLSDANLRSANLSGAKHDQQTTWGPRQWLPFGSLIMFKKVYTTGGAHRIATLRVPESAARTSSIVGRKCRVSFAVVERVECADGSPAPADETEWVSGHINSFVYRVGETVVPDAWDDSPLVECTHGIHCFVTREEAVEY